MICNAACMLFYLMDVVMAARIITPLRCCLMGRYGDCLFEESSWV